MTCQTAERLHYRMIAGSRIPLEIIQQVYPTNPTAIDVRATFATEQESTIVEENSTVVGGASKPYSVFITLNGGLPNTTYEITLTITYSNGTIVKLPLIVQVEEWIEGGYTPPRRLIAVPQASGGGSSAQTPNAIVARTASGAGESNASGNASGVITRLSSGFGNNASTQKAAGVVTKLASGAGESNTSGTASGVLTRLTSGGGKVKTSTNNPSPTVQRNVGGTGEANTSGTASSTAQRSTSGKGGNTTLSKAVATSNKNTSGAGKATSSNTASGIIARLAGGTGEANSSSFASGVVQKNAGGGGGFSSSKGSVGGVALKDPVANMSSLLGYWDFSAPTTESTQINKTFAPSVINTATGNLTTASLALGITVGTSGGAWNATQFNSSATEVFFTSTGTLPAPLVANTPYYLRENGIELEIYPKDAQTDGGIVPYTAPIGDCPPAMSWMLGKRRIVLTTQGTGTHTITTKPLVTKVVSQTPIGVTFEPEQGTLNGYSELLVNPTNGKKYLSLKGTLSKDLRFAGMEGGGKCLSLQGGNLFKLAFSQGLSDKRYLWMATLIQPRHQAYAANAQVILSASNINTTTGVFTKPTNPVATNHSFNTGDPVGIQPVESATLPTGLVAWNPATPTANQYFVRSLSTTTFQLHPTLADATANTNVIIPSNAGSGDFVVFETRDLLGVPYNHINVDLNYPGINNSASGNPYQSSQHLISPTTRVSIGTSNGYFHNGTTTPCYFASTKAWRGVVVTGPARNNIAPPVNTAPIKVRLRMGASATVPSPLNQTTDYWAVPRLVNTNGTDNTSDDAYLFDTEQKALNWIAILVPAEAQAKAGNSTSLTNAITALNTQIVGSNNGIGSMVWYRTDNAVTNVGIDSAYQCPILPAIPTDKPIIQVMMWDADNPSATHWLFSQGVNDVDNITKNLLANITGQDVRTKGVIPSQWASSQMNSFIGRPAQNHRPGCGDIYALAIGASNTDPTSDLRNILIPYWKTLWKLDDVNPSP